MVVASFIPGKLSELTADRALVATLLVAASNALAPLRADSSCDGTADNVQIQAALDALPVGGGTVVLTEGQFNVAASVNVPAKCRLIGSGMAATILRLANAVNAPVVQSKTALDTDIVVADLTIDGNRANQSSGGHGLQLGRNQNSGGSGHEVRNVYAKDCYDSGIAIYSAQFCLLVGCRADGMSGGSGSRGNGFYLPNCRYSRVIGCYANSNANAGVELANHGLTPGGWECVVQGSHFGGNVVGVECDDGVRHVIAQNTMLNNSGSGINLFGDGHIVVGNEFWNSPIGIKLNGGAGMVIATNVFTTIATLGIQLLGGATCYELGNIGANQISSGVATILSGQTSVVVSHSAPAAPRVVQVTGGHAETAAAIAGTITSTQLTITVPSAVTADRTVYWSVTP